jgi:hypothetical protein
LKVQKFAKGPKPIRPSGPPRQKTRRNGFEPLIKPKRPSQPTCTKFTSTTSQNNSKKRGKPFRKISEKEGRKKTHVILSSPSFHHGAQGNKEKNSFLRWATDLKAPLLLKKYGFSHCPAVYRRYLWKNVCGSINWKSELMEKTRQATYQSDTVLFIVFPKRLAQSSMAWLKLLIAQWSCKTLPQNGPPQLQM